jgi:hypothetical protein
MPLIFLRAKHGACTQKAHPDWHGLAAIVLRRPMMR